ncbi:hypothetical protein GOP47_0020045 [Adiantum capillus-veneris]|uniref:Uncharacterized protein n=1 Tax=Adiantum capillus-veneris TaxID=13818 RepID=A0A9D4Z922_ADICA|nr:hypothetical protein GOP47_0020045 [Adiantum capillus-veneris]
MAATFTCGRSELLGVSLKVDNSSHALHSGATRLHCTTSATENVKLFAQHTFYKGKSALSIHPGRPTFKNREGAFVLEKEGTMFLEFAPSTGPRQYDWTQKQVLALSVVEMGSLVALTMSDSIEFFHDPNLGSSDAGKVRKSLKVEPMNDRSGFFFNFNMTNKYNNVEMHLTVPVTKGEFAVMRSSFNFMIPYLMGWHAYVNPSAIQSGANNRVDSDLEWSK